ncbi:MAG: PHP domain-containing protein [Acidobacteria bacterium]|nr:PHP domain-containing protein [Acidobacteriota bacterium]MBV9478258.1 PHP domain-containing protein [Acidobacteriota bacterium]
MRYADLHTHTFHSDGTRSPREVIDVARTHAVTILAISDHDNLAAYYEAKPYADEVGVTLVPAIELSCGFEGIDVHVLAYAFEPHDERIAQRLQSFRESRHRRGYAMVEKLRALGFDIRPERVDELAAGGAMGRPHVARALVEKRYVASVSEAFDKYLGTGKPAYVEKERFRITEAVALIRDAGGVTSIAHPTLYPDHEQLVPRLLDEGVDAIEVMHPDVDALNRERYTNLARFRGKFTTGGSDDHGAVKKTETLGTIRVPESMIGPILERV